jgi:hypothetical protein
MWEREIERNPMSTPNTFECSGTCVCVNAAILDNNKQRNKQKDRQTDRQTEKRRLWKQGLYVGEQLNRWVKYSDVYNSLKETSYSYSTFFSKTNFLFNFVWNSWEINMNKSCKIVINYTMYWLTFVELAGSWLFCQNCKNFWLCYWKNTVRYTVFRIIF